MKLWSLVFKEIRHRKMPFVLGLLAVAAAAACFTGALTLLHSHDLRTAGILAERQAETSREMKKLEDDFRKITKNMGFNVLILPKDQNLSDLYADDFASKFMPEEYATRLANSKIVTINHLLPSLQIKTKWPEEDRTVLVIGVKGEVPIAWLDQTEEKKKKPLLEPVAPGTMVLGHELHKGLKVKAGGKVRFMGREFTVTKTHKERGNKDDITAWINLGEAQSLFKKEGLINGIVALECYCAADRLDKVRAEIAGILPETQVIEFSTQAIARAESRTRAAEAAKVALAQEERGRLALRAEYENLSALLIPIMLLLSVSAIAFLTIANVRERRGEIGILRAIGFSGTQILSVFLGRNLLIGLGGALVGYLAGYFFAVLKGGLPGLSFGQSLAALYLNPVLWLCLLGAPLLACLAGWIPALSAAGQDPADTLREG